MIINIIGYNTDFAATQWIITRACIAAAVDWPAVVAAEDEEGVLPHATLTQQAGDVAYSSVQPVNLQCGDDVIE